MRERAAALLMRKGYRRLLFQLSSSIFMGIFVRGKNTLDKHGIYPATYYSWKNKFESMGEAGFHHGMTPEYLKEIRHLVNPHLTDLHGAMKICDKVVILHD